MKRLTALTLVLVLFAAPAAASNHLDGYQAPDVNYSTQDCTVANSSNLSDNFVHNMSCPDDMSGLMNSANTAMGGGFTVGALFVFWGVVVVSLRKNGNPFLGSVIAGNVVTMFASFFLFIGEILGQEWPILFIFATAGSVMASWLSKGR